MIFIKNRLKDFEESNLSINKEIYNLMTKLSKDDKLEKESSHYIVQFVNSKLSETKFTD